MPRFKLRTMLIAITAFCILLALVVNHLRWSREQNTTRMLNRLAMETDIQISVTHELPPSNIYALVRDLNSNGSHLPPWFLERRAKYPGLEQGVDAWGHTVIVETRNGSTIDFRSKGPNGIDEQGQGDDIQFSIDCRRHLDPVLPSWWRNGGLGGRGAITALPANAAAPSNAAARSIEGIYLLYRWEDQPGELMRVMEITARTEKEFSIRGLDEAWSGEGMIDGNNGYYHWVFVTGERGTTTLTMNSDGTLKGEVRGDIAPWTYLARRAKEDAGKP